MSPAMVAAAAIAGEVVDVRGRGRAGGAMTTQGAHRWCASRVAALPLRGDDIDTDRIIPARFLKAVTFEGLEAHVFEDERRRAPDRGRIPSTMPRSAARAPRGNRNFGCGSSREHAPQALLRWGIRAVVGESFSEIFFGNASRWGFRA